MYRYIFAILVSFLSSAQIFAAQISTQVTTTHDLVNDRKLFFVDILAYIQDFLLKGLVPLVVVGSALYIAYELFLAEGNEEKLKKAWKTLTFTVIGLMMITLSYAIISLASRLSL